MANPRTPVQVCLCDEGIQAVISRQLSEFESILLKKIDETARNAAEDPAFATLLNNLAVVYHAAGKFGESDALHKQCLAILEAAFGPRHRQVAQSLANRSSLYRTFHEYAEAERLFQVAIRSWDQQSWPSESEMRINLEDSPSAFDREMLW